MDVLPGGPRTQALLDAHVARYIPPPPTVSHYTTLDGARGILSSASMWATSLLHLNDRTEWSYARDLCHESLESTPSPTAVHSALRDRCCATISGDLADTAFAVSFSKDADDLSQWRAYGESARGICLTFDTASLFAVCAAQGFLLMPVTYDRNEATAWTAALVADHFARLNGDGASNGTDAATDGMARDLASSLLSLAPFMKSSHFNAEREWRAYAPLTDGDARIFQRTGSSGSSVPTVTLSIRSARIVEVRAGPLAPAGAAESVARAAAVDVLSCERSGIPLR